jgi:hypothetical protein
VSSLADLSGLCEEQNMWLPLIALAGILMIVGMIVLFVSVYVKRRTHRGIVGEAPSLRGELPTVRGELRRIAREAEVPDVMPRGVRRANALNTADQLDSVHSDGGSGGDSGSDGSGGEGD